MEGAETAGGSLFKTTRVSRRSRDAAAAPELARPGESSVGKSVAAGSAAARCPSAPPRGAARSAAAARASRAAAASTLGHAHSRYRRSTGTNAPELSAARRVSSPRFSRGDPRYVYRRGSRRVGGSPGSAASGGSARPERTPAFAAEFACSFRKSLVAVPTNAARAAGVVGAATARPSAKTARSAICGAPNVTCVGANSRLSRSARRTESARRWHGAVAASASHGRNR